jgi:hypothetical protein
VRKKLVLSDGTRERELQLVGRLVVGRDPACEISHDHSLLSRRHAEFVTAGDVVTVRDLGSRNGVFVNGSRAVEHVLEAGDIVQIGPLRARYLVDSAATTFTPESLDVDRTALIRNAFAAAQEEVAPVPAAVAGPVDDDEDVTRMVPAPRMRRAAAPPPDPLSLFSAGHDEEGPTQFVSGPDTDVRDLMGGGRMVPAAPAAVAAPAGQRGAVTGAPVENDLTSFVFVQLLTLAAVILAAAAMPILLWRRAALAGAAGEGASISLVWLALPTAVALIATYLIGTLINRRITGALAGVERGRR